MRYDHISSTITWLVRLIRTLALSRDHFSLISCPTVWPPHPLPHSKPNQDCLQQPSTSWHDHNDQQHSSTLLLSPCWWHKHDSLRLPWQEGYHQSRVTRQHWRCCPRVGSPASWVSCIWLHPKQWPSCHHFHWPNNHQIYSTVKKSN